MAELAGNVNIIYILTGAVAMTDSTGAKILSIDSSTYNHICSLYDISQFGDTYTKRLAGLKDVNMNISGTYYSGDTTGQDELVPGDSVYIGFYPSGTATAGTQFPAIVESVAYGATVNGKQTISATIQGNGAPVTLPAQA